MTFILLSPCESISNIQLCKLSHWKSLGFLISSDSDIPSLSSHGFAVILDSFEPQDP